MSFRARVIGYIPLEGQRAKTRMSKLLDVNRAKNDGDRLNKLIASAKAFDHCDADEHDSDIKAGAVAIVCSILRSYSPFFIAKSKEIRHCLAILLSLYGCSDERLCASFCTDGCVLILDLLELIEINYRLGKKGDAKSLVMAQHVIDKLMVGARVPLTMIKQQGALLSSLVANINGATGRFAMHLTMKIIASLSECSQNKRVLFAFPGMMEAVELGSTHMCEAVRDESARIIMNLSLDTKNGSHLIRCEKKWLDAVLTLAAGSSASRSCAIQTLGYLASIPDNKAAMVYHKSGIVIDTLLRVASSRIARSHLSINAARTIGSLSCQATALWIGCHPGLLVTLSSLACGVDRLAVVAAMTVKKIATHVRSGHYCHGQLLQALVTVSYSRATEVLKWIVKAFYEQAQSDVDRQSMIAHEGVLTSLAMLANDENDFLREYAQEVLSALACDVANAKNVGVEKVLRCVSASKLCRADMGNKRLSPRSYSPSSVGQFDADFAAYF